MKVLQFCFRVPVPANDGGAIAMYNMAKGFLDNNVDLEVLSYNTTKHFVDLDAANDEVYTPERTFTFGITNDVNPLNAFLNLFTKDSYNVSRFVSEDMKNFIRKALWGKQYDVIHFEGLFTSPYLQLLKELFPKAKFVLRQHNIEYKIWERLATSSSGVKKSYLKILTKRLKDYEYQLLPQFDAIIPITAVDEFYLNKLGILNTFVSETGVLLEQFDNIREQEVANTVGFIGSLDWMPNQEGLKWFCQSVWPLIHKKRPSATFNVAGKNPSEEIKRLHNPILGINVIGQVVNAVSFMKQQEILVVPLLSGSGMRIKIIEAMAARRAIVSTTIGAEGIIIKNACLLADTPNNFANSVLNLLNNEVLREQLGHQSLDLVEKTYANKRKVAELIDYYENLI